MFQTSQVYIPLVLLIVVSVCTTKGLQPCIVSKVNSAIGSSIVYIIIVSASGLHPQSLLTVSITCTESLSLVIESSGG